MVFFFGEVRNKNVVQGEIGDGGGESAMEAGVVAPDRGVGVDRKNGGDNLSGKKKDDGEI